MDDNYVIDNIDSYPGIKALLNNKILKSGLNIKMGLFSRNQDSIMEYLKSGSERVMSEEDYNRFLELINKYHNSIWKDENQKHNRR